ncbi:MAG: hypothetical protein AUJ71_00300 [Candidatus Omnitrophica bacterium CG1_02_49_16]|nr:MAG: hypothetical protein AUJ71_00300 [Candidatus Omnitrophica bacterium CG1_02_49_16]
MRSSTFNSDSSAPALAYGRLGLTALLVAGCLFSFSEHTLRLKGFDASLEDSKTFWVVKRHEVYTSGEKKGSSSPGPRARKWD